jgi:hypothetical protein
MGYGISWVAIRDNKENALLDVLGLEKTCESEDTPDSEWSTTRIGDWTVVWSNRFEPKKFRHARSKLKRGSNHLRRGGTHYVFLSRCI